MPQPSQTSPESIATGDFICIESYGSERFLVQDILKGGMGLVFRVLPVNPFFPTMALKTLQASADVKQFRTECEIWLRLCDHPGIARARWYGTWLGRPAILADWYESTLDGFRLLSLATPELSAFVTSVCDALHFAYTRFGVIHQDIKPANILIDKAGLPRIADFGIARVSPLRLSVVPHKSILDKRTHAEGSVGGTPFFMAPELLFESSTPSIQTDIYSFGVTFLIVITGIHPYITAVPAFSRTLQQDMIMALRNASRHLPKHLPEVLLRCVSIDPAQRPASWQDLSCCLNPKAIPRSRPSAKAVDVDATIAQVQFYRSKRDFKSAYALIQEALSAMPHESALLNALGLMCLREKRFDKARQAFERACNLLHKGNGIRNGRVYLDPLANLARLQIETGCFEDAARYLSLGKSWLEKANENQKYRIETLYAEFAWLSIWKGNFKEAYETLIKISETRSPDDTWLRWALLAYLSERHVKLDNSPLFNAAKTIAIGDLTTALAVCAIASLAGTTQCHQLLKRIPADIHAMIAEMEQKTLNTTMSLRPPRDDEAKHVVLSAIDLDVSGGRHYGNV